jgi:hypothetical protein
MTANEIFAMEREQRKKKCSVAQFPTPEPRFKIKRTTYSEEEIKRMKEENEKY